MKGNIKTMSKLLQYIEKQITKLQNIKKNYNDQIQEVKKIAENEYQSFGEVLIHLTAQQQQQRLILANQGIKELEKACDDEINTIIVETENYLSEEKKKVIQVVSASEPVPTQDDRNRMDLLLDEYSVIDGTQFRSDMEMHIANETVYAFPYYLLAKKHFAKTPENESYLKELYNKMFPAVQDKLSKLDEVEEAVKTFRTYVITIKYPRSDGDVMIGEEATFERIKMKQELASMGTLASAAAINPAINF